MSALLFLTKYLSSSWSTVEILFFFHLIHRGVCTNWIGAPPFTERLKVNKETTKTCFEFKLAAIPVCVTQCNRKRYSSPTKWNTPRLRGWKWVLTSVDIECSLASPLSAERFFRTLGFCVTQIYRFQIGSRRRVTLFCESVVTSVWQTKFQLSSAVSELFRRPPVKF